MRARILCKKEAVCEIAGHGGGCPDRGCGYVPAVNCDLSSHCRISVNLIGEFKVESVLSGILTR